MKDNLIRSFLAVKIPGENLAALEKLQLKLKESPAAVNWVRCMSIHLTMKFLGEISPDKAMEIEEALLPVLADLPSWEAVIRGVGGFPNLIRPRVLWVGIEDKEKRFADLASRIDKTTAPLGFKKEKRPFTPHLTLGRVKAFKAVEEVCARMKAEADFEGGSFLVKELVLFKSDLAPTGAVHTPLAVLPFKKN